MAHTFVEMKAKLSSLLKDKTTTGPYPTEKREREINRGCLDFCKMTKCLEAYDGTTTTTNGQAYIDMPSDFLALKYALYNDAELTQISLDEYGQYKNYNGTPPICYIWGNKMYFIPTPANSTDVVKLWYYKKDAELSADDSVSAIREEWRDIPVYKAASELLRQIGKYAQANELLRIYIAKCQDVMGELQEDKRESQRIVTQPEEDFLHHGSVDVGED